MPTVMRVGPYRFFFYSNEGSEPPHVHVEREGCTAKFWIAPVDLARSGFPGVETERLRRLVVDHRATFEEAWHDHFGR